MQEFPGIDGAAWFGLDEARAKLLEGQVPFLGGWRYPSQWCSSPPQVTVGLQVVPGDEKCPVPSF